MDTTPARTLLLTACAALAAHGLAQTPDPAKDNAICNVDYTAAYMSMLGNGPCQKDSACTPSCQGLIDKVVHSCPHMVFTEQAMDAKNTTLQRSFLWRAITTLSLQGPVDCNYAAGFESCTAECSMAAITGGSTTTDFERDHCIDVDPQSGQSSPEAVWHSCEGPCAAKLQSLNTNCGSCTDPVFETFLTDAGRKFGRCALQGDAACTNKSVLNGALNLACCGGADGVVGNDDDTCAIPGRMPEFFGNPVCTSAVQSAALQCPHQFITDPVLLGLFEDCGGQLTQLWAAEPVETDAAHYCADQPHAYVDPNPHQGRRLGDAANVDAKVAEIFAYARQHPFEGPAATIVHREPRVLQAVTPVQPSAGNQNCSAAYQAVFTSTLPPNGACHSAHCGIACQTLISDMLHKCQGQTFTQTVDGTDITYSFSQQAADALRMLGPQDCTYEDGFASCHASCTPSDIMKTLNQNHWTDGVVNTDDAVCANTFMGISLREWNGCTKPAPHQDQQQTDAHKQKCWKRFMGVAQKCSGCSNLFVKKMLKDFAVANAQPECEACDQPQVVADKVHELCCAGTDGILGNADDPCTLRVSCADTTPIDCHTHPDKRYANPSCGAGADGVVGTDDDEPSRLGAPCSEMEENPEHTFIPAVAAACQDDEGLNHANRSASQEACELTGNTFVEASCSGPCAVPCTEENCTGADRGSAAASWGGDMVTFTDKSCTNTATSLPVSTDAFHDQHSCERSGFMFSPGTPARCQNKQTTTDVNGVEQPQSWLESSNRTCLLQHKPPTCPADGFASVKWYNPSTCAADGVCKAFVQEIAQSGGSCTTSFLNNSQARQVYADCHGDLTALNEAGRDCDFDAFEKAFPGATPGHPPLSAETSTDIHRRASWNDCVNETSKEPFLKAGHSCAMTCSTGYCVKDGSKQPHCVDGSIIMGDSPMQCDVQPIATCTFPPNGGCDPLTKCNDTKPGLFMLKIVSCGDCPPGYFGTGRSGCNDINECMLRKNGGCASGTQCTNSVGGYSCSACPAGTHGDSFREKGCCPFPDKVYRPVGQAGASCDDPEAHISAGSKIWIIIVVLVVAACAGGWGYLCSKKQYKDAGGKFEKIDVGSIGTGPSIYDSTWAR